MNVKTIINAVAIGTKQSSAKIAIGAGVAGMFVGAYSAGVDTLKAHKLVEELDVAPSTKLGTVKATWKCYIPTALILASSTALILMGVRGESKKYAALAAAYTLLEKSNIDLKEAVEAVVSDEDKTKIGEHIAKRNVERAESRGAIMDDHIIRAGEGDELFMDAMSGRLFFSSVDEIKQAVIECNYDMLNGGCLSVNDLYYELGLDPVTLGEDLGWNANRGQLTARFDGHITDDNRACILFSPSYMPISTYMML